MCNDLHMRSAALVPAGLLSACASASPLAVQASVQADVCYLRINGDEKSSAQLDEAMLRELAKAHGNKATIDADAGTPWRCVAGVIYNLQAAGFHVVLKDGIVTSTQ